MSQLPAAHTHPPVDGYFPRSFTTLLLSAPPAQQNETVLNCLSPMTTNPEPSRKQRRGYGRLRRIVTISVVVLACCIALQRLRPRTENKVVWNTEPVIQARFLKAVPGKGEIRTYQPIIVYNDCRNYEREILDLVPEGTWVEEGDLICVLDCSELKDQLNKQQTELIKAKAALVNAEAQRELQNFHNARRRAAGGFQLSQAKDKLRSFEEAESGQELDVLRNSVLLKRQETDSSRELYEQARQFTAMGYQSSNSLATADAVYEGTARRLDQADDLFQLTHRYLHPRSRLELTTGAELAVKDVERIALQCQLTNAVTAVSVLEAQKWVAGVQRYVDYLTGAIDACTIYSPGSGELIYCHKRDEGKYIEVGSRVHYMQNLVRITDRSQLTVSGRVSDRQAHAVTVGQPVLITVPTIPDEVFHGTLDWIAPIPSEGAWYLPNDLHHKLQVMLTDESSRLDQLALGASAQLSIIVDDRPDVIQVSTNAVIPRNDGYAVIVENQQGLHVQTVTLGVSNDSTVEVLSGLEGGEQVVIEDRMKLRTLASSLPEDIGRRSPFDEQADLYSMRSGD